MKRKFSATFMVLIFLSGLGVWGLWRREVRGQGETVATTNSGWAETLRVMTANVRMAGEDDGRNAWMLRRDFLIKTVLKKNADLIGCQEVTPTQGAFLVKSLTPYYGHYPQAGLGKIYGPTDGRLMGVLMESIASFNTLFYRADRFDWIDGEGGMVLPNDLQKQATENTFYTMLILHDKVWGKKLIVVDTHIRHGEDFAVKCSLALREKIGKRLKQYPGAEVLVMGDMNHDQNDVAYRALVGVEGAVDGAGVLADSFDYSKKPKNESWGNYHAFTGKPQAQWPTDLVLSNSTLTPTATEIVRDHDENGRYPSDHFFTMATFSRK